MEGLVVKNTGSWYVVKDADGSSKTQSKTSFGLGLYYVARTAKALKIKIKVESTPGEGSSFILLLPEKMITNTRQEKQS